MVFGPVYVLENRVDCIYWDLLGLEERSPYCDFRACACTREVSKVTTKDAGDETVVSTAT